MRFVCDSCRAQYMISDDKVGAKGVKVRCKKCGYNIVVRPAGATSAKEDGPGSEAGGGAAAAQDSSNSEGLGLPSSLGTPPDGGLFGGVEEDEIGAVFDQVLNTGSQKPESPAPVAASAASEAVRKMAEAEAGSTKPAASHEWFVAIDEKQVGPLSMEKVKEHWDKGEVGPDSLCWRAGFGDWIPLSEATELASVLAPRPTRPVIVEPTPVASSSPVSSGPVESAFSAGGSSKKAETPAPVTPSAQESGWKPSAASVLASLVKEENEALSKPAPKAAPVEEKAKPMASGLLDVLPPEPAAAPASPMMAEPRAPAPYMPPAPAPAYAPPPQGYAPPPQGYPQPQYAQPQPGYAPPPPAYPGYPPAAPPPQQGGKMGMVIGAVAAVLVLGGVGIFFATRPPAPTPVAVPTTPPPQAVAQQTQTPPTPKPVEPAPATASATPTTPPPATESAAKTASAATPATGTTTNPTTVPAAGTVATTAPTTPAPTPPAETKPSAPAKPEQPQVASVTPADRGGKKLSSVGSRAPQTHTEDPPPRTTKPSAGASKSEDDEFDDMFGTKKKTEPAPQKTATVYVPDAPGGASVEKLSQQDIMQVVLSNKPAIVKCVSEQKKKDPGLSGQLVMRWTIQTNGKTKGVSCQTGEFRSTYMATCISGLIKGWSFPKHRVQGDPIDFPFKF